MSSNSAALAYLVEPRFSGGTSSSLATELGVVAGADLKVFGLKSAMFRGEQPVERLQSALNATGTRFEWASKTLSAPTIVLHNPACLKLQDRLGVSLLADTLIVVTHENFYRPSGEPAFDIESALDAIARSSIARRKILAPISPYNRAGVAQWAASPHNRGWDVLDENWFNICDFEMVAPTDRPRDRRGRLSRPGNEKFPPLAALDASFPVTAGTNCLLGADSLAPFVQKRPHWDLRPFGSMEVSDFFDEVDFIVYHTAPTWRESFGRAIAESIAAGKLVITDAETAANFGEGVVIATPERASEVIADLIAQPSKYQDIVLKGQRHLERYSPDAFRAFFRRAVTQR